MAIIGNNVDTVTGNMVSVTVIAGKRLTREVSGFLTVFEGGDVVLVPAFEAVYLRRDGVVT